MKRLILSFGLLTLALPGAALGAGLPRCHPLLSPGDLCQAEIDSIRPTQPEVGALEVRIKSEKYARLDTTGLEQLIREKTAPLVIGPEGKLFLVDHHHSLLALQRIGVRRAFFRVQENWSDSHSLSVFWKRMLAKGYGWMRTEDGQTLSPLSPEFPQTLEQCGNNRMRSVVYLLIQSGALKKGGELYHEFRVAEALRRKGFQAEDGQVRETAKAIEVWLRTPEGRRFEANALTHSTGRGEISVSVGS